MSDHNPQSTPATGAVPAVWMPIQTLSDPARRVLAHIRGRTITGQFACRIWNMPSSTWEAALDELDQAGYRIVWTYGTVADDPAVSGGYILR